MSQSDNLLVLAWFFAYRRRWVAADPKVPEFGRFGGASSAPEAG